MQRLRPSPAPTPRRLRARAPLTGVTGATLVVAAACAAPPDVEPASSRPDVTASTSAAPPPVLASATRTTITLITGDRVHVIERAGMAPSTAIEPAPGRAAVSFTTTTGRFGRRGDLFIVPGDAEPLLATGRVDPRLFDVSELLRDGYDDARRADLPLIVTYTQPGAHLRARALSGSRMVRSLASVNGAVLTAKKAGATQFWRTITAGASPAALAPASGVARLWLDGKEHLLLDKSVPQIGAPAAWARGFTGKGVTIAILDSGVLDSHPDLKGRISEARDFTADPPEAPVDTAGHGTHVAGIIGGTGAASGGKYRGVAPEATLLSGRVCIVLGCDDSWIIAGMEWAAPRARIVNMSLGGGPTDGTDVLSLAVDRLTAQFGTLFVISAGNSGVNSGGVGTPATAASALAVASVTKQDEMSDFSSRGPRTDAALKPDIAAPGSDIISARAPGTVAGDEAPVDDNYTILSGTSMSAPHVAGAAALLAQQHPDWRAPELKAALMSTSHPIANATVYDQGAGRLDIDRATAQRVFATTPSVSFGLFAFPHDQPAVTRTVTYRNDGAAPVTLGLALTADQDGQPATTSPFALDAPSVTVPAGGTADVHVTFDPAHAGTALYGGWITATAGDVHVVVALGAFPEPESYNLTIHAATRHDEDDMTVLLVNTANQDHREIRLAAERTVLHLRRGRYDVLASSTAPDGSYQVALVSPNVALDRDAEITLDARTAEPVTVDLGRPTVLQYVSAQIGSGKDPLTRASIDLFGADTLYLAPSEPVDDDHLLFGLAIGAGSLPGAEPYRYSLEFKRRDRIPSPHFQVSDAELATVHARFYPQGGGNYQARRMDMAIDDDFLTLNSVRQPLSAHTTEYFLARPGLAWTHNLELLTAIDDPRGEFDETTFGQPVTYVPGSSVDAEWNRAPLGPAFGGFPFRTEREGDFATITLGLFSPSEPGHATDSVGMLGGVDNKHGGATGSTTLSRDGQVLQTIDLAGFMLADLPAERATYTLSTTATRSNPFTNLGTRAEATWTFQSAHADGVQVLPLLAVRTSGAVDDSGVAAAGGSYPVTLHVERPTGAAPTTVTELTLDASYDDGATWQAAAVQRSGDTGSATLQHPAGSGFVSLRASARDADGNAVRHTIIRAYAIAGGGTGGGGTGGGGSGSGGNGGGSGSGGGTGSGGSGGGSGSGSSGGGSSGGGGGCSAAGGSPGMLAGLLLASLGLRRRRRQ